MMTAACADEGHVGYAHLSFFLVGTDSVRLGVSRLDRAECMMS